MPARILIADDNPSVRKTVRLLLQGPDTEILEAENGQQAVSQAVEQRPQIAVLDLAMPVMDGLTAARHIHNQLPELPILMYTMHWSSQLELEAIKSGIRKVIAKADSASLVAAIQDVLKAIPPPAAAVPAPQPAILPIPPDPVGVLPAIEPAAATPVEPIAAETPVIPAKPAEPAS
jgi:CheY-like chemotaxis protein